MSRFFFLVVLAVLGWWWWRKRQHPRAEGKPPVLLEPERMVVCARCGVNQPLSECVRSGRTDGLYFCCEAHRREAEPDRA